MFRMLRRMPFFRVLAIGQVILLARRHFRHLDANDRRRLRELVLRGHELSSTERDELRGLLSKLEPREFAFAAASRFSPVRLPHWLSGRSS
jgi:hypothetical protein